MHGVCGAWGVLAVGLFADGTYGTGWNGVSGTVKGLFYGDAGQLGAEMFEVVIGFLWCDKRSPSGPLRVDQKKKPEQLAPVR